MSEAVLPGALAAANLKMTLPHGGPMNVLADTYTQLSGTLRSLLQARGFEVAEEHHHADASGAKCLLLTSGAESFRLVWDGRASAFRVDYCPERHDRSCPAWQTLVETSFTPGVAASRQAKDLAAQIEQTLARHLESAP